MTIWQVPTGQPKLAGDRVHLWRANLDLPAIKIAALSRLLSEDELARANKFRFAIHKNRFIASRGILRQLLSNYLQINAQDLKFDYGDRGKPLLKQTQLEISLQFNISHSQEYALFGFTYNHLIGVDLEYLRDMKDASKIAQRFFSEEEFNLIAGLDIGQQPPVFFKLWTAKEAYLKAIGIGLTGSLAGIKIALDRVGDAQIVAVDGDNYKAKDWYLCSCIPKDSYVGAIAIQTLVSKPQIDFWIWEQDF